MKSAFSAILEDWQQGKSRRVLVSDGAMGTQLMQRGLTKGACPEGWNDSNPQAIASIHKLYYEAGSDLVETNTFGGNRLRLDHYALGERTVELNRKAVEVARSVCPAGKFVAGSVGPTGAMMEPFGTMTEAQAFDVFSEQITALIDAGADLIIIETMMDLNEILSAVRAARQCSREIPLVATMTFEGSPAGYFTSMGVNPGSAFQQLSQHGADIIGANCGKGVDEMIAIMKAFRDVTDMPLLAQANAGIPEVDEGTLTYPETPEERGGAAETLISLGVNIIGGCCGTGPDHIRAIRKVVDSK